MTTAPPAPRPTRLGLLVNPHAARHARHPDLVDRLARVAGPDAVLQAPGRPEDVRGAMETLHAARVDTVAISGGDGTVHLAVSEIARAWGTSELPAIILVPAGTMNTVARSLGGAGRPDAILARVVNGPRRATHRTAIDAGDGRLGFLVGTGFWARFLAAYDAAAGPGPLRAAAVLSRGLLSTATGGRFVQQMFEPIPATVRWDGAPLPPSRWTMVAAGTVDQVGLGFAPFRHIGDHPGTLHALAFTSPPGRVARQLPRLYRGASPQEPDRGGRVTSLEIEADTPFAWAIDGDLQPPTATLRLVPGPTLRFLVPGPPKAADHRYGARM